MYFKPGMVVLTFNPQNTGGRGREAEREAERQRGREAERQRGREAERQRERQRGREAERQRQQDLRASKVKRVYIVSSRTDRAILVRLCMTLNNENNNNSNMKRN
jgi:hypothetical protein